MMLQNSVLKATLQSRLRMNVKIGLSKMLKNGVIMDVTSVEEARTAEQAGAVAVMVLERNPSDIRKYGGVARACDPFLIKKIKQTVTIPVMAKCRIGHTIEARILEAVEVDFIDESEVLTVADPFSHIDKWKFRVPFVCGCRNLGEALRRIQEGAALIRLKGEAGTGNIVEAVRHAKELRREIEEIQSCKETGALERKAIEYGVKISYLKNVRKDGRLPVPVFSAGGIATPADAALMMHLGVEAVFVGSGIFKSSNPSKFAKSIVQAVFHHKNAEALAKLSENLGTPMSGVGDIETDKNNFRDRESGGDTADRW